MLGNSAWLEQADEFATGLRGSGRTAGGLLLVGTPDSEPWHLAAHLDEESRLAGVPELAPALVRWAPAINGPSHLRIGMDRLAHAHRGETLFVVAPEAAPAPLLERVDDARRSGATVLAMSVEDKDLGSVANDQLTVDPEVPMLTFDGAEHLVGYAAATPTSRKRPGLRERLAQLLDTIAGPSDSI